MKPGLIARVLAWLGGLMLLAGVAMVAYAAYAAVRGVVYLASCSTKATIHFNQSPLAFLIGIALYLAGGVLFLWISWGLLPRKKKAA